MKNEHLLVFFVVLVGLSIMGIWFYSSSSELQVGAALYGIPGSDPITPLMAVTLLIWFLIVGTIVFMHKPHK